MFDRERLLAEEAAAWRLLREALGVADRGPGGGPARTADARDTAYHVAWWLEECARTLEAIGAGASTPRVAAAARSAFDETNARIAQAAGLLTPEQAFEALSRARTRARNAFSSLPDLTAEAWTWFEEAAPLHYAAHADEMRASSDRLRGAAEDPG